MTEHGPKVREFISREICQQLCTREVKLLAYSQDLPGSYFTKDGTEVLLKLEMMDKFSKHNLNPLAEMMTVIGRKDLAKKIQNFIKNQKKAKNSLDSPVSEDRKLIECLVRSFKIIKRQAKIFLEQMKELQAIARLLNYKKLKDNIADLTAIFEQQVQQKLSLVSGLGSLDSSDGDSLNRHHSSSSSDDGQETRPPVATSFQTWPQFDALNEVKTSKFVHAIKHCNASLCDEL